MKLKKQQDQLSQIEEYVAQNPPTWGSKEEIEQSRRIRSAWVDLQLKLCEATEKTAGEPLGLWT